MSGSRSAHPYRGADLAHWFQHSVAVLSQAESPHRGPLNRSDSRFSTLSSSPVSPTVAGRHLLNDNHLRSRAYEKFLVCHVGTSGSTPRPPRGDVGDEESAENLLAGPSIERPSMRRFRLTKKGERVLEPMRKVCAAVGVRRTGGTLASAIAVRPIYGERGVKQLTAVFMNGCPVRH